MAGHTLYGAYFVPMTDYAALHLSADTLPPYQLGVAALLKFVNDDLPNESTARGLYVVVYALVYRWLHSRKL